MTLGGLEVGVGHAERGLVRPVDEPDPREQRLVVVQVRIGDEAGGEQVEVDHPGDGSRDGRLRKGCRDRGLPCLALSTRSGCHAGPGHHLQAC